MRRVATLAATALVPFVLGLAPAFAAGVGVSMDEVKVIAFAKPVSTVYVGNTVIADVTMIDSKHAFVLGKTYGTTNLLALAQDGAVVTNEPVTVTGRRAGLVTLNRGAAQFNYSCTASHCETQPIPGDVLEYFKETHDAQTQHETMAEQQSAIAVAASSAPGGN